MSYMKNELYDVQEVMKTKILNCMADIECDICWQFPKLFDFSNSKDCHTIRTIFVDVVNQLAEEGEL